MQQEGDQPQRARRAQPIYDPDDVDAVTTLPSSGNKLETTMEQNPNLSNQAEPKPGAEARRAQSSSSDPA